MENNKLLLGTLCLSIGLCHGAIADETSPSVEAKVLNGEATKDLASNLLPWQAAILSPQSVLGSISACGAVVISDYWAVTAAHCAEDKAGLSNTLVAGTTYIPQGRAHDVAPQYKFEIVEKIVHENYDSGSDDFIDASELNYDIALLRIDDSTNKKLTSVATPIKIATPAEQTAANAEFVSTWNASGYSTGNLIASGWGNTAPDYNVSDDLQVVKLGGIPLDQCIASYLTISSSNITPFVCADSNNPAIKKDVCQGDSGGPLVWQNKEHTGDSDLGLRLVGVTSNGPSCKEKYDEIAGAAQQNGLYTELAEYYSWIEDKTGLDLDTLPTPKFNQNPFDLVREDQHVSTESSSGSSSGGSVPLGALAMMALAAIFRRKK